MLTSSVCKTMSLKRQCVSFRYPILLFAMFLQHGTSSLRTNGGSPFRRAFLCFSRSSIIILNDLSFAKKYLVNVGKNTIRPSNRLSNVDVAALIISGRKRLFISNETFHSTSGSTMTYISATYSVSEPKLREASKGLTMGPNRKGKADNESPAGKKGEKDACSLCLGGRGVCSVKELFYSKNG
jgi:hypothetical protein